MTSPSHKLSSHLRRALLVATAAALALTGLLLAVSTGPLPAAADPVPGAIPGSDRVYELVSPADAGGPIEFTRFHYLQSLTEFGEKVPGIVTFGPYVEPGGNLIGPISSPLQVRAGGSAVFWQSQQTPPGTGALEDNAALDSFRSVRTPTGWSTEDLLPSGVLTELNTSGAPKYLLDASADGSSALILTPIALGPDSQDFVNPQEAASDNWQGALIYRVSAEGGAGHPSFTPQLTTIGSVPFLSSAEFVALSDGHLQGPFDALSASPDLGTLAFRSELPLEPSEPCDATIQTGTMPLNNVYLWHAASPDGHAHAAVDFGAGPCTPPDLGSVPTILPDGRPLVYPSQVHQNTPGDPSNVIPPGDPLGSQAYTVGPLVENSPDNSSAAAFTPLTGPSGATYLTTSPDGSTAYVASSDPLDAKYPGAAGRQIYAISTTEGTGWQGSGPVPASNENGETPGVTCLSCGAADGAATYAALSKDGSHLFFSSASGALWEYDFQAEAQPLKEIAPASAEPTLALAPGQQQPPISQNGRHLVVQTNSSSGLTELNQGAPSAEVNGCGKAVGVTDDGNRVVCDGESAGLGVINEWVGGQVTQISPLDSPHPYTVTAVAGAQLADVFFFSSQPLLPSDENGGANDIYDARVNGGFPQPPASCSGDACQGTPSTPPSAGPTPASQTFAGPENQPPTHRRCRKPKTLKNGRCVKKKTGKRHHARHANANRRAGK